MVALLGRQAIQIQELFALASKAFQHQNILKTAYIKR